MSKKEIPNEPKRAALYIRVSTDDQLEFSPDAQKNALIAYAEKNNMTVAKAHIFVEEGKSGRTVSKRPEFMRMIGIAKSKPKQFDVILVHKFDRFARNRQDSIVYKSMLNRDYGIRVISATESLNEDDRMSILIEALLEAMAEYYSINLAEEVKKGMTEKAKQGGFQSSPSLGYYVDKKNIQLTIHPEESETIKYIFNQYLEFDRGPFQIAKALNDMGVKTKRGNLMDGRGIEYILQNPVYIGINRWTPTGRVRLNFNHPDTILERGSHEPIISEENFKAAAEKLSKRVKRAKRKERPLNECSHWLSGLIKCSACGSTLAIASSSKSPSFQCSNYAKAKCKISHSITIKKIETAVVGEISHIFGGIVAKSFEIKNIVRTDDAQDEIKLRQRQLEKISDKLERAKDAYLAGIDSLEEYNASKLSLTGQKRDLEAEIDELRNVQPEISQEAISQRFGSLVDLLISNCDIQTKQKAVRSIIQKIVYSKPNEILEIYYFDM